MSEPEKKNRQLERGADRRERAAIASRAENASIRDIGKIPPIKNLKRRNSTRRNFRKFLLVYGGETFNLPFGPEHDNAIAKIEDAVLRGGQFALAMTRGYGKTTLLEWAVLWAISHGHRKYIAEIGATAGKAEDIIESIKVTIETNDLYAKDFPEIAFPIRALEGITKRCQGQTCEGVRTRIEWGAAKLVLPTIKGSKASGAVIQGEGILGAIRGMRHKTAAGRTVRPDLALVDDPQTDESAASEIECQKRERVISRGVLGLAGRNKKIAAFVACTVIREGDLSDRILDPVKHPEWHPQRTKMLMAPPSNETLWGKYADLRKEGQRAGDKGAAATAFYRANRAAMDAGAVVSWEHAFKEDELSALQSAMNWRIDDEAGFQAEGQNDPMPMVGPADDGLTIGIVSERLHRRAQGTVPAGCQRLTGFVDLQERALFWVVVGWKTGLTGYVVDYGIWPEQRVLNPRYATLRHTIANVPAYRGMSVEGAAYKALEDLTGLLVAKEWPVELGAGATMRVEKIGVDAGFLAKNVVYPLCRQAAHSAALQACKGKYIGPSAAMISEWKIAHGLERRGEEWLLTRPTSDRPVSLLTFDTNYWKSRVRARLACGIGDPGAITLYGDKPHVHETFAAHTLAENRTRVHAKGRTYDEWSLPPSKPDNHWWDGLVGATVIASSLGVESHERQSIPKSKRKVVKFSEQARARRAAGR